MRLLIILLLLAYLGVSCNYIVIQSSHIVYHLITNSFHPHDHIAFEHDHHHGHSHTNGHEHHHLIDQALQELDVKKEKNKEPEAPAVPLKVKFTDHFAGITKPYTHQIEGGNLGCTPYHFSFEEISPDPPEHPPKYRINI